MQETRSISDIVDTLIGDTPVSEQLGAALVRMSEKTHEHKEYATRDEVMELSQKIDMLIGLVGDTSVSEQISMAINNIKK